MHSLSLPCNVVSEEHLVEQSVSLVAANVLLHSSTAIKHGFSAKVADFGACMLSDMELPAEEECAVRGTFTHVAPEIVDGQRCTKVGLFPWMLPVCLGKRDSFVSAVETKRSKGASQKSGIHLLNYRQHKVEQHADCQKAAYFEMHVIRN